MSVAAAKGLELAARWRLLSLGLSLPDNESIDELEALASALGDLAADPAGLEALLAALADAGEREGLEAEYHRLFDGEAPVPPYEGAWESDPFRHVRQLSDIAGFYRAFGAEAGGPAAERADHVACELEFLAFLAARRLELEAAGDSEGANTCRNAEDAFLADHVGRWLPHFCRALLGATTSAVYACIAELGKDVVTAELERRGIVPAPLARRRRLDVEADCFECGLADAPDDASQ
jgi:DMSO reductase family type II enzyme chaperone